MPRPEESGISIDREREVRGTYIGGFPEPERAIRGGGGLPKPRGCCAESPVAQKVLLGGRPVPARAYCGRRLDCVIVLW